MFSRDPFSVVDHPFSALNPADTGIPSDQAQYFSTHGLDFNNVHYKEGVIQPLDLTQSLGTFFTGRVSTTGEMLLNNMDGSFDHLLEGYAVDAQPITVSIGRPSWSFAQFTSIFKGTLERWVGLYGVLVMYLRDKMHKLDIPIQSSFYAGSGGTEGGADLKGRPKPLCYGAVYNVPAVLVDAVNLIYQVHNGAINDIVAVYDRGVSLTEVAGAPAPGEYQQDLTNGRFTLGGTPDGLVTADVQGSSSGGGPSGYITSTADIINRIVIDRGGLLASDLNTSAFTAMNTDNNSIVGIWIDSPITISDVVGALVTGVGGFVYFNRAGLMSLAVFKAPSGTSAATYTTDDIITIDQEPLPTDMNPVVWRRQVGYKLNYAVQNDLAASVSATQRAFAEQQYRIAIASDGTVQTRHPLAQDPPPVAAFFTSSTDAQTEADRLLALYKVERFLYRVKVKRNVYNLHINSVVTLDYPRWNLHDGKQGVIVGMRLDAADNSAELLVFV